jgi:hypothetical protein
MAGTEVGQESAREEDWASHEITNAFTEMLVDKEYVPYLTLSCRGEYYAWG